MKIKLKKFVYLINDATNILLKRDKEEEFEKAEKLRKAFIVVGIILVLSIALNIYFYLNYV